MSIFRDNKRGLHTGERSSASPPASGVSHIADLAAAIASSNAEALSAASPAHVSRSSGELRSSVRAAARPKAIRLIRQALSPLSLGTLACIVDAQPQHLGLALSEHAPTKPFAAENFVLMAERDEELGTRLVKAYSTLFRPDVVEALGHDLIRLAREMRRGMVGQ
jgi:hypothetical protein